MEHFHPTPPARVRSRARARGAAAAPDDERWRSLALRWWRAHPGAGSAPVPPHGTQLLYYSVEDLRDVLQLGRLVRGPRGSTQWAPGATEWRPNEILQKLGAGTLPTDKPRQVQEPGVMMLIMLLAICIVFLRLSEKCMERLRRMCSGRGRDEGSSNSSEDNNPSDSPGARRVPRCQGFRNEELDLESSGLDLPPPYAQVVDGADSNTESSTDNAAGPKLEEQEPPPPYSECAVVV